MTEGTSQGLFVVVAIVIFGIFVVLANTLFGSEGLTNDLKGLFETSLEQATTNLTGKKNVYFEDNFTDLKVDSERFSGYKGGGRIIDDNDTYNGQHTFRWDFRFAESDGGILVNLTEDELNSVDVGDTFTFSTILTSHYGNGTLKFELIGDLSSDVISIKAPLNSQSYKPLEAVVTVTDKNISELKKGHLKVSMENSPAVVWLSELDISIDYN